MTDAGFPKYFNVERYLDAVEDMILSDEVERAYSMLDNLPGYYRDHVPERAKEIRESLNRQLWTPVQYAGIYENCDESRYWPGRAQVLEKVVRDLNAQALAPHVMELAPGSGFIEQGLSARELEFFYTSIGLDKKDTEAIVPDDTLGIFCAFEIIEHLADEWEIYRNYLKFKREAKIVLLSTPLYTCARLEGDWRKQDLGHLRTYTPFEFGSVCAKMFQGYEWECFVDETIILKGVKA